MKAFLPVLLVLSCLCASAQSLRDKIQNAYAQFESDDQMRYGISAFSVLNAETGELIFSANGDKGLASASTLKAVTAATAYHLLGKDFTWETTLGYNGHLSAEGVLSGDLILTGSGDPALGSERYAQSKSEVLLKRWLDAVKRAGIRSISGRIIADDRLYGTQTMPGGWTWQDMGNYYGAGPSALTWRENQFDLIFEAGAVGEPARFVRAEPEMSYLTIINEVTTGRPGTGDNVYAYSAPFSNIIYLRGTYGQDLKKKIGASVPDPAFDAAYRLHSTLSSNGVVISGKPETTRMIAAANAAFVPAAKVIDTYSSPTLDEIVYWFNQRSINLYGEHLIKTLAWKQNKEISTANGVSVMRDFWNQRLGIDKDALNVYDGSGLSPANRITSNAMASILQSARRESWFSGYLRSLPTYNNMKMKSGTISDVLGYTGYHTSSSGIPVVFSFLINNYRGSSSSARQKMFRVLDTLK